MVGVKVCGITRREDAQLAADLGAYAVGFVLWPGSRRYIAPHRAQEIATSLPANLLKVGVFVDQPIEDVAAVARLVGLDAIQLHGSESVEYARALPGAIIKAIPVGETFAPALVDDVPDDIMPLLDAHDPVQRGGTGRTIDWRVAAQAAARRRVILAGGLGPGNIREALAAVQPFAVDLSSGLESAPGVKDHDKMRALFEALHHD